MSVTKATATISTTQQPATAGIGFSIADQATVSSGYNPTGTVTFRLYGNSTATGSPLFTDTEALSSGSATSSGYATTAIGTFYWVATYNGDTNNSTASSPTADEPVTVTKATVSISTTQQPASSAVGSSIADKATVSGGYQPTGTVTFKLHDNANGTGAALFTDTESLSNGSATSAGYPTSATGTYYWVATYNGNADNSAASSGTADEPVTVATAKPSISTTQQPATAAVGSLIADQASLSGGDGPTRDDHFQAVRQPQRHRHRAVRRHRAGNKYYTIIELPKLNHAFQTCEIGSWDEYEQTEETIAPLALNIMTDWILERVATMSDGR